MIVFQKLIQNLYLIIQWLSNKHSFKNILLIIYNINNRIKTFFIMKKHFRTLFLINMMKKFENNYKIIDKTNLMIKRKFLIII